MGPSWNKKKKINHSYRSIHCSKDPKSLVTGPALKPFKLMAHESVQNNSTIHLSGSYTMSNVKDHNLSQIQTTFLSARGPFY